MKSKRTNNKPAKRYLERKLSVSKLIKFIPEELIEKIGKETQVDFR
jgi:hypothetical protein